MPVAYPWLCTKGSNVNSQAGGKYYRIATPDAAAGLHAMMAMRAKAHPVTAVDRWLRLSLACKDKLVVLWVLLDTFKP